MTLLALKEKPTGDTPVAARPMRPVTPPRQLSCAPVGLAKRKVARIFRKRNVARFSAYIDTLTVFVRDWPMAGDRKAIEKIYGRSVRLSLVKRWNSRLHGFEVVGFRVTVQCPTKNMLDHLDVLLRDRGGSIRRVDISYEGQSDIFSLPEFVGYTKRHLLLSHRRAGVMNTEFVGSAYLTMNAQLKDRSVDGMIYWDRAHKRGDRNVGLKIELRIRGKQNVSNILGAEGVLDLLRINPSDLFFQKFDVSWTVDPEKVTASVKRAIRKNLLAERRQHQERRKGRNSKPSSAHIARQERHRASLPKRESRIWAHRDLEWLQRVADFFPHLLKPSTDTISVEAELRWDAKARLDRTP